MRVRRLRPRRRTFQRRFAPTPSHAEVDTEGDDIIEAWEAGGSDEQDK